MNGDKCVILDNLNQIQEKPPRELNRNGLVQLCGRNGCLRTTPSAIAKARSSTASVRGEFRTRSNTPARAKGFSQPLKRVRGRGAWIDEDGRLVLHLGDMVLIDGRQVPPGLVGEFVYPGAPAIPKPWSTPVRGGIDGVGSELLKIVETWNWGRPKRVPRLVIGWIGAAMVGGALHWRASIWLTGDPGPANPPC